MRIRMLNGYRVIHLPSHPKAMGSKNWKGFVYEHIVIAEEMIGRPLNTNEEVHHLNGDRTDNTEKNLIVLEKSQHTKLHMWLRYGASGSESFRVEGMNSGKSKSRELTYCITCGKVLSREQKKYCSRQCFPSKRPPKEMLEKDISEMSFLAIGRKYGVSDNAVRKWAKKYDLI